MRPYLASTKLRSRYRLPPPGERQPDGRVQQAQQPLEKANAGQQQQQQQQQEQQQQEQAAAAPPAAGGASGSGGGTIGGTSSDARFLYDLYAVVVHRGTFQAGSLPPAPRCFCFCCAWEVGRTGAMLLSPLLSPLLSSPLLPSLERSPRPSPQGGTRR